jgi:hypothetical protein
VRLLVLGGTKFLGRGVVECALQRGHVVTLFNRGHTNPDLFPEAERLCGDREGDLGALRGCDWDAVVDPSDYVPGVVRRSAEALGNSVGHYVFISSISAYANFSEPRREGDPLAPLDPEHRTEELREDYANYGSLKPYARARSPASSPTRHTTFVPGCSSDRTTRTDASHTGPIDSPAAAMCWRPHLPPNRAVRRRPRTSVRGSLTSASAASGLTFRPRDETVHGAFEHAEPTADAGLSSDREAELLETWLNRWVRRGS